MDEELALLASWFIGERDYDDEIDVLAKRWIHGEPDEKTCIAWATAVSKASTRYRREHGKWPAYTRDGLPS